MKTPRTLVKLALAASLFCLAAEAAARSFSAGVEIMMAAVLLAIL